eukprot:TRINITY_DN577_c0_g1_i3.p1 TRINITY_DN577_c0_g1~~TRINITY_DN577_c0_g1_i3.p1  ORF type:complete len:652 (+),score=296.62 TRINITY_DN577_c0_g1_i3:52-2007(+)
MATANNELNLIESAALRASVAIIVFKVQISELSISRTIRFNETTTIAETKKQILTRNPLGNQELYGLCYFDQQLQQEIWLQENKPLKYYALKLQNLVELKKKPILTIKHLDNNVHSILFDPSQKVSDLIENLIGKFKDPEWPVQLYDATRDKWIKSEDILGENVEIYKQKVELRYKPRTAKVAIQLNTLESSILNYDKLMTAEQAVNHILSRKSSNNNNNQENKNLGLFMIHAPDSKLESINIEEVVKINQGLWLIPGSLLSEYQIRSHDWLIVRICPSIIPNTKQFIKTPTTNVITLLDRSRQIIRKKKYFMHTTVNDIINSYSKAMQIDLAINDNNNNNTNSSSSNSSNSNNTNNANNAFLDNNNNNNNNNSSSKFFSNNSSISSISSSNNNNNSNLSTITWRRQGVKHAVNELFVDLIEEIDCIIEAGGLTVASSIHGRLEVQSHLSGMPDLTLFFNRTNLIEASSLHPCVRLARYQQDQTVSFIPPDGNFTLLTYMAHQPIQLPIYCKPQIAFGKEGGNVNVILGQKTVENEDVTDVIVILPFPKFVTSTSLNANVGNIIYDDINRICRWSLTKLPKDKTPVLSGKVSVDSTFQTNCTMTAQLQFEIIGSTVSGLKVTSINMFGENYKPFKGVRRITRAGNFQIRCN